MHLVLVLGSRLSAQRPGGVLSRSGCWGFLWETSPRQVAQCWGSSLGVRDLGLGPALVDQAQVAVATLGLFGAPRQGHPVHPLGPPIGLEVDITAKCPHQFTRTLMEWTKGGPMAAQPDNPLQNPGIGGRHQTQAGDQS